MNMVFKDILNTLKQYRLFIPPYNHASSSSTVVSALFLSASFSTAAIFVKAEDTNRNLRTSVSLIIKNV